MSALPVHRYLLSAAEFNLVLINFHQTQIVDLIADEKALAIRRDDIRPRPARHLNDLKRQLFRFQLRPVIHGQRGSITLVELGEHPFQLF